MILTCCKTTFLFITVLPLWVNPLQLPTQWTADFTISLSYSGSMRGGSTEILFSYDKGAYTSISPKGKYINYTFNMTESLRKEILTKMHAWRVASIKSNPGAYAVNDSWSRSICFGTSCLEGGTSAEMSDEDKHRFLDAYNYLQQVALEKKP